jgi:hypothetical protein
MLKQAPSLRANSGAGEFLVRRGKQGKQSKGEEEKGSARGMPHAACYRLVTPHCSGTETVCGESEGVAR